MTQGIDITGTVQDLPHADPWVVCPACGEEWTKLRECFWFVDKRKEKSSLCVQCAESLKSFKWIIRAWPMAAPYENWPDGWLEAYAFFPEGVISNQFCNSFDLITKKPIKEKVVMWKTMMGVVKAWHGEKQPNQQPMFSFLLRGDMANGRIFAINQKNKEDQVVYDNAIEAWCGMKNRIMASVVDFEKADKVEKESWQGPKKKFKRF